MNRHKLVPVISLVAILIGLSAFIVYGSRLPEDRQLGLEITTNSSEKPLYFLVALPSDKRKPYATIPVSGGGEVSAVRIVPLMENGTVNLDAYLVSGDIGQVKSCAEMKLLPAKLLETRSVEEGKAITFGDREWSITVRAVERRTLPPQDEKLLEPADTGCANCGSATCGGLTCTPCRGACMGCGRCGSVCCG